MSELKTVVGSWRLKWKTVPRGDHGTAQVEANGRLLEVTWRRDKDGIWLLFPDGMKGFDLQGELNEEGLISYQVSQRLGNREWIGVSPLYGDSEAQTLGQKKTSKGTRVRAQMPGKIIRVLVESGQAIQKDQPLLVMEAMKMENEIRAPQAGKVGQIKVQEGQAVETGADLILMEM